ncbi:MAG: CRTAC1 family protein [Holophagales bacterium]|nr:CRTAC1 family protein [Holophagales bacterium]MYG28964.1 CRTAC1 family protein [Holophagales bacterium]MYI80716.1 CRTAC1 family protein [Holophagales bacterium]
MLATLALAAILATAPGSPEDASPAFVEVGADVGIDFVHYNGMTGQLYTAEVVGAGVALFDYDNDGDLDVYLGQGRSFEGDENRQPVFPPPAAEPTDRLFRNGLAETGELRFTDVTAEIGLHAPGYNIGVATGDYDRDGWVDLYLTNLGPNRLLRNLGGRGFEDVTETAGVHDRRFSVPAVFFDYDADGWLDLYVGNYHRFHRANRKRCFLTSGQPDYCGPLSQPAEADRLLRNLGDGTFVDATVSSGLGADSVEAGTALGAIADDFNGDGLVDLYVANDQMANHLWLNQGDGTFLEDAVFAGAAFDRDGRPQASMGVAVADFDGNGAPDIFLSHLVREHNTLYLNDGDGLFDDRSREAGLIDASWPMTGFGAASLDVDGDGLHDLYVVNGAVRRIEVQVEVRDPHPLRMENQLFRGLGGGRFEAVPAERREQPVHVEVSRGLAVGDLDNDGDPDLVISNNAGPARVLLNQRRPGRDWVGLRLVEAAGDDGQGIVDVYGARARLTDGGGWQRVHTDGSYAAARDPRLLFPLPGDGAPAGEGAKRAVEIRWPDGTAQTVTLETGRYHVVQRGAEDRGASP